MLAGVHGPVAGLALGQRHDGWHRLAGEAQFAVRIVLDDEEAMLDRQLQQAQAALARNGGATGIGERRHHAHDLGLDARGKLIERVDVDAVRAGRHGMHRGAGVAQRLHGIREGRRFDDGMVTGLEHHTGQQRHGLLRPTGDGQFRVRVAVQAARRRQPRQFVAQTGLSVDVRVLQAGAKPRQHLGGGDRQAVHVEQFLRRIAARQRNGARPHRVGHQRTDRGGGGIQERRGKSVLGRGAGHGGGDGEEKGGPASSCGRRRRLRTLKSKQISPNSKPAAPAGSTKMRRGADRCGETVRARPTLWDIPYRRDPA